MSTSDRKPIPLLAIQVELGSQDFREILNWPYADSFVSRLLQEDIPQRVLFSNCHVWLYRDPNNQTVGFGTLDLCGDYKEHTGGKIHPYIPLLAANPTIKSLGYGTTILQHLTDQATLWAATPNLCYDVLYLDVYTTSEKAIGLYTQAGFMVVSPEPIPDQQDNAKLYIVMGKRLTIV